MSVHHLECAALTSLPAARKLVLMALCDSADKITGIAYPGMDTLRGWSNLQQSQVMAHLAALIEDGYIERLERARPGRRAVFRVFARVACCALHEPLGLQNGSGQPENDGSGTPENGPNGSGNGSGGGSGPDRNPSVSPESPPMEGYVTTSPGRAADVPPPNDDAQEQKAVSPLTRPDRCARHQHDDVAPPCGGCRDARQRHEEYAAAEEAARRQAAQQEARQRRAEARRLRRLDIDACDLCDDDGRDPSGLPCHHDPDVRERARRGLASVRAALEKPAVAS